MDEIDVKTIEDIKDYVKSLDAHDSILLIKSCFAKAIEFIQENSKLRQSEYLMSKHKNCKNSESKPNGYTLLADGWLDASTAPDYFSFRCLIKFKEFGMDGPEKNHVSTGYWWHKDNCFTVDNIEMKNMTPKEFIPLYDDIN